MSRVPEYVIGLSGSSVLASLELSHLYEYQVIGGGIITYKATNKFTRGLLHLTATAVAAVGGRP